jgi:hypothetical protein
MSSKTEIANLMAVRIGEKLFTDVDNENTTTANEFNAIWPSVLDETLGIGPELGWAFARWDVSDVEVDNTAITAFASATSTTTTVTSATHGLVTGDLTCITETANYDGEYTITKVSDDAYTIVKTFVADDATGTSQWTSKRYMFRYARPLSTRVTMVRQQGVRVPGWIRRGNWILTNLSQDSVSMDYIRLASDLVITEFPLHFVDVMWRKMAIHMMYTRVQNRALLEELVTELEQIYLPRAKGMDAREQYVQEQDQSWVTRGHGGGNNNGFNQPNYPGNTHFR